eukprot:3453232-Amphidinium_carterae.2
MGFWGSSTGHVRLSMYCPPKKFGDKFIFRSSMAGVSAADLSLLGASPSLVRIIMQWARLIAANVAGL